LLKEFYFNLNFSTRRGFSNHSFNHNFTFSKEKNGKIWVDQEIMDTSKIRHIW